MGTRKIEGGNRKNTNGGYIFSESRQILWYTRQNDKKKDGYRKNNAPGHGQFLAQVSFLKKKYVNSYCNSILSLAKLVMVF